MLVLTMCLETYNWYTSQAHFHDLHVVENALIADFLGIK